MFLIEAPTPKTPNPFLNLISYSQNTPKKEARVSELLLIPRSEALALPTFQG